MPLYDCMLLFKPHMKAEALTDLVIKVGKHVYGRNGVLTEIKSLGTVQLGYGIKKLDGRYYQGKMMQMTMMTPPNFNNELHYLNKEDRLLRWLLVKNRGDLQLDSSDNYVPLRTQVHQEFRGDEKEDSSDEDTEN
ncbi:unnamed protein product [Cuscuta epithymum]|uniref:Ribosomal protein S6 n=1 Tax=Cuscuta epithymum TaxID=186058 RepID=A0AAV0EFK4_9ASTE|nr:unnamed protein product [Cuscuta epithymum]CAH9121396.1 unnamed protein product [Cuscuta epithymum]